MDIKEFTNSNLSTLNADVIKIFNQLSEAADKKVSSYLIGFGSTLILLSITIKLQFFGTTLSALQPVEFITILIISSIFIVVGSLLRFFVYKNNYEITKAQQKFGANIIKDTLEKGFDLVDKKSDDN